MYETIEPEKKRPNNFRDALHNDHFKEALVKFMTSTYGEEKYVNNYIAKQRIMPKL